MGNRATCPVCSSNTSSILADINNGNNCRVCDCSNELLVEYQEILSRKEIYQKNLINNNLLEENDKLIRENFILKSKIEKLVEIFGYEFDSPLINSIMEAIKFIHENQS